MPGDGVDVVIPAFKAAAFLPTTMASIAAQTLKPHRVIVVDDGSPDNTADVAASVSAVTVVRQANSGQGAARATGTGLCVSPYLLFLDADDVLLPTAIGELVAALKSNSAAPAAYCRASIWDGNDPPTLITDKPLQQIDVDGDASSAILRSNFIRTPGCVLIRTEALQRAGGWDCRRSMSGHEDWDLWIRLAKLGPFVRVPRALLWYREQPGGFSKNLARMDRSKRLVVRKIRRLYANDPITLSHLSTLRLPQRRNWNQLWKLSRLAAKRGRPVKAVGVAWLGTRELGRSTGRALRCYLRSMVPDCIVSIVRQYRKS